MNIETYLARAAELGIDRGALATEFNPADLITVDKRTIVHHYSSKPPKRQVPPPDLVLDDLSWMNPKNAHKKGGRPRKQPSEERFPRPGEMNLKHWFLEQAQREGLRRWETVQARFYRGYYQRMQLRRVNARIIFITP